MQRHRQLRRILDGRDELRRRLSLRDPLFCDPTDCGLPVEEDWSLDARSPCLPEQSPCGELIGALGPGCGTSIPTGACCFPDRLCAVLSEEECDELAGTYQGDYVLCEPDPCVPISVETVTWGRIKARYRIINDIED